MKREVPTHWKFEALRDQLGVTRYRVVGILETLWWWVAEHRDDGRLTALPALGVASVIGWEGDPQQLVRALVACGWLDLEADGTLVVHDWHDHCPTYVYERRKKRAARARPKPGQSRDNPRGSGTVPDVSRANEQEQDIAAREIPGQSRDCPPESGDLPGQPGDNPTQAGLDRAGLDRTGDRSSESDQRSVRARASEAPAAESPHPPSENPADGCDPVAAPPLRDAGPVGDPLADTLRELRAIRAELTGGTLLRADDDALRRHLAELHGLGLLHKAPPAFRAFHRDKHWAPAFPVKAYVAQFSSFDAQASASKTGERRHAARRGTASPASRPWPAPKQPETWEALRSGLARSLGAKSYRDWIAPLALVSDSDDGIVLGAPNSLVVEFIEKNYRGVIEELAPGLRVTLLTPAQADAGPQP